MWSVMGTGYLCNTEELALRIGDYAPIGDCPLQVWSGATAASMGSVSSPLDAPSTFGAFLGTEDHGRWLPAHAGEIVSTSRRYETDTFILVTRGVTTKG